MLRVVVSDRLEMLADALAVRLATAPSEELWAGPTIVVPSRGMERWLTMRLAGRFGIWAGASFPFPERWLESLAAALGLAPAEPSRWSRGAVECALYDLLRSSNDPEIRAWTGGEREGRRLLALARQIAECFDQYAAYRPDWLLAWDEGRCPPDLGPQNSDATWQARLWTALVARLGPDHPARRLARIGEELRRRRAPPEGLALPLHLFGLSALPPIHLQLLAEFARIADANVWVFNPCREMWFETTPPTTAADAAELADVSPAADVAPWLLSLNGRLARDFLAQLYEAANWQVEELWSEPDRDPPGALGTLRRRILEGLPEPAPGQPRAPWPDDPTRPSIAVHVCHSPRREIEVLRDRLLDLFDRDADLTPRDVLVMAPDIEPYTPHIAAVFGSEEPPLPWSIADRSPLLVGHLADALRRILRLPDGETTAPELFDLLALPPVRARFGLDDDSLARIRDWLTRAAIRRGGDEPDRPNSWCSGLERLTLGAMVRLPPLVTIGDRLPVELDDTATLDTLWAFWAEICNAHRDLAGPHHPEEWRRLVLRAMDRLLAPSPEETFEYAELRRSVERWADDCTVAGLTAPLPLPVVRDMIEQRLDPSALAAPFLRGGITFCNLRPMRSVPFRVIALLGMNDTDFPRRDTPAPFDLMRVAPRRGDRRRRLDDRQLFLETLFAARDHLHISYVGRDARNNEPRPPSVCVGELLDALDRTFDAAGRPPREFACVEHPLHPFSPLYFDAAPGPLFSYSARARRAVAALRERAAPCPAILSLQLPPPEEPVRLTLEELVRFFRDPVADLLRRRLDATVSRPDEELNDAEPLPGFDEPPRALVRAWIEISDEALGERPVPLDRLLAAAGHLPPGPAGFAMLQQVRCVADGLVRRLAPLREPPLPPVELHRETPRGIVLDAQLTDLRPSGLLRWTPGRIRPADRLAAWLAHLVLHAARPDGRWRTVLVGSEETLELPPPDDPLAQLDRWLEAFADGLCRPLAIWPDCALAFVSAHDPDAAAAAARSAWSNERGHGLRDRRPLLRALFPADHDIVTPDFVRLANTLFRPLATVPEAAGASE